MALFNPPSVIVSDPASGTSTPTTVASSATNVIILAANSNRKGATIWNESTSNLFIEFGGVATTSAFTGKLNAGGYYEVPFHYTGVISGIWTAVNGSALVRELT